MSDTQTTENIPYKKSLFLGLYGEEVIQMKMNLNELNDYFHFSDKASLKETNYFNFDTVHYIREFQKYCGIPTTGAYDSLTQYKVECKYYEMLAGVRIASKIPLVKSPKPIDKGSLERQKQIDKVMGTSRKW